MATQTPVSSTFPAVAAPVGDRIPPLESGDRLSRAEFERRWEAMPDLKRAELIRGVVYIQSRVTAWHGERSAFLITWLGTYSMCTPGTCGCASATVRLSDDCEPQPDASLHIDPVCGGRIHLSPEGIIEGPVELAAEVCNCSASFDLHDKLEVYQNYGVREYVVWRIYENELNWFVLQDGKYEQLTAAEDGILRSRAFPGLWLDKKALLSGDYATVVRVVKEGTLSAEHELFVQRLRHASKAK